MELDQHRLTSRIAASLLFAILAYIGLLFGGNLVILPAAALNNTLSSSGRDPQPQQLTARDAVRGVLAADRKLATKQAMHDAGSPALAAPPVVDFAGRNMATPVPAPEAPLPAAVFRIYQPRAPPTAA